MSMFRSGVALLKRFRRSALAILAFGIMASLFASCDKLLDSNDVGDRDIRVYLPPGYDGSSKRYPVVYLLDGEQWNIDGLLNNFIRAGRIDEMIVVKISSTENRTSDFLPYEDPYVSSQNGSFTPNARRFADYIVGTLIPSIDSKYRTLSNRDNRAIVGASYGGLCATWIAFNYDATFSAVGAFSPSYWVADFRIFTEIAAMPKKDIKVYYDTGTLEWDYILPLSDVLVQKGHLYGSEVLYHEVKDGRHTVIDWIARIHIPLILFKGPAAKEVVGFQTQLEVIKSSMETGKYFLRLNPVVTMDNGLRYSAAQFATYELQNLADGVVRRDGSFDFFATKDLAVRIYYQNIMDTVLVSYAEVQGMK